jgi:undecaprenyl-diphosphatase
MNSFDADILRFLNQFSRRSFTWDAFVTTLEEVNLLKGAAIMAGFLWIWFRDGENKTRDREFVLLSLLASAASVFLARALALTLPFRERPLRNPSLHFQLPYVMNPETLHNWSSFPSDHAAFSFTAATCLLFISRRLGILALFYSFFVICFPRVYLGIHYPTDIVVGALLGIAMAFWVKLSSLRTAVTRPFLRWEQLYPRRFYTIFFVVGFEFSEMFDSLRAIGKFVLIGAKTAADQLLR